jgi:protein tyrosine phosphatase (PTP) superfamily phosphohydrolase (DUF442 family)
MANSSPLPRDAIVDRTTFHCPSILYIIGYGRSGSTLLGNILGEIPGVTHAGELRQLWRSGFGLGILCGCGEAMSDCPVWAEVTEKVSGQHVDTLTAAERAAVFERALSFRQMPALLRQRGRLSPGAQLHAAWRSETYRALAGVTQASLIVDSSKYATDAALLSHGSALPCYFVHLVRDPRAVAYSWQRVRDLPSVPGAARQMVRYDAWSSARAWMLSNLASELVCSSAGRDHHLRVRYEDFVASPQQVVDEIARFAGVRPEWSPIQQERSVHLGHNHAVGGNPIKMARGLVNVRPDDEWRDSQPQAEQFTVTAVTLPLLLRYGYPVRARSETAAAKAPSVDPAEMPAERGAPGDDPQNTPRPAGQEHTAESSPHHQTERDFAMNDTNRAGKALSNGTRAATHPASILFITLDSCRFDTMEAAQATNIKAIGSLNKVFAPGSLTYTSHTAMFMGFTPGMPNVREPYLNPKWGRIFRVQGAGEGGGTVAPFADLRGRNVIDGLKRRGYRAIGTGAVSWFNPGLPTSQILTKEFEKFHYPGNPWSLGSQLNFMNGALDDVDGPVFAFMNVGETHAPYYYQGAPWSRQPNPCQPFGENNDADECRRRQLACLEWVDGEIAPLLARFADANVIICADHGDAWGEDGLWNHGIHHPTVLEVPLLYRLIHSPNDVELSSATRSREFLRAAPSAARLRLNAVRRVLSAR